MHDKGSFMDCNKEEAARCKAISEAHFKRNDLMGAKKYALKARQLFPELEGLPQLSSILDVHFAALYKLRTGDSNCYGILQVDFKADDNTIRKQYRKLALLLHPDKNKAFGAEAAFKHISEAWSVLSDTDKKSGFDKRLREHMVAAAASGHPIQGFFQNLGTFRSSQHVHRPQGQFHTRVQPQGHGQFQSQQQRQAHAYAYSQHGQGQSSFPRPQGPWQGSVPRPKGQGSASLPRQQGPGQGHAYAYSQPGQGQASVLRPQGQGPAHVSQQQFRDQARVPDQRGQNQGRAHQQQGQNESSIQQGQGQSQAHVYKQQEQCQVHVEHQQGQAQVHAHPQQGQGTRQAHQAPVAQKYQGPEHQVQGEVPVHQQRQCPAHAHQQVHAHQQGEGQVIGSQQQRQGHAHPPQQQVRDQLHTPEQQGQREGHAHQDEAPVQQRQGQRLAHVNEQQAQFQVHVQNQQGQGPVHACPQQGQGRTQVQGQAYRAPVSQKENHAFEHGVQGQVHVDQQCQGPAHTYQQVHAHQQGQGPTYAHQQQGQYQTQAQGQAHQAPVSQNNQAQVNKPFQPAFQHSNSTFWTACSSCRMQIEYERVYVNKSLCCPMCYKAFFAKEITSVQGHVIWPPPISHFIPVIKTDAGIKSGLLDSSFHSIPGANSTLPEMVHPNKKAKMDTEDILLRQIGHQKPQEAPAQPAQKPVDLQQKGLGRVDKDKLRKMAALHTKEGLQRLIARSKGVIAQKLAEERERKSAADKASEVGKNQKAENERSAPASEPIVQNRPVANGKKDYVHKIEEKAIGADACNSKLSTHNSTERRKESRVSQEGCGLSKVEALQRKRKLASPVDKIIKDQNEDALNVLQEFKSYGVGGSKDKEVSNECSLQKDDAGGLADKCRMEVPDPDFHNFDGDRTEDHFVIGQIWASYDDDDGMPRYYSRVNKILSRRPLKMQMNWLEACSLSEVTLAWLDAGFQHSCGDFLLGSMYIAEEVSTFSHLMAVEKRPKGGLKLYPRQGEVWAVYRDWEILKVKEDKRGYDMVEIVSNFAEGKGIQISPLLKVAGFKTIFARKAGEDHVKWIPPQELRRLSHQVPAHRIMAGEVPGILVDCLELDPASTPMDLIYGKQ